ncbi:MAG: PQQ-binding-like beta-propeller repeat protein [Methanoregula sp.]|nr:PQQ-binding-like beta-propeller repeat protein [Methanoregula sp.]
MKHLLLWILCGIILAGIFVLIAPVSAIQPLWAFPLSENTTYESNLNTIQLSDDGNFIAAYVADEKTLRYFDRSGTLLWTRTFSAESDPWISSVSIARDGSAVAVSQLVPGCCRGVVTNTTSNQIFLFDRNGSILWNYTALVPPLAVAIAPDNRMIYASFSDSRIRCFNREGLVQWTNTTDAPVIAFAISGDGGVIAAAATNSDGSSPGDVSYPWDFFVFNQNGIPLGKYRTGGPNAVEISKDGNTIAVMGGKFGNLYLFNRSGKIILEKSFPGTGASLAMSQDANRIMAGTIEGNVYGLDTAGTVLGETKASPLSRTIAVATDASSVAYGDNRTVTSSNPAGRILWQYPTGAWVSGVALSADGRYLGAISDKIYLFDLNTKESELKTTEPARALPQTITTPAGEAYMYQAGPTTIPPQLCEPLDISRTSSPSITIDPIDWHGAGESFLITGTTHLPADQEILVEVMTADFLSRKSLPGNVFGQTGTVRSKAGPDGIGRWEFQVNTSGWVPDKYLVQVTPLPEYGSTHFTHHFYLITSEEATGIRKLPVTVDPVPSPYDGETFTLTGNTTLSPGQELTVSVMPGSFLMKEGPLPQNNRAMGIEGKTRVVSGSNGVNRWSLNLNTTGLDPTTYAIDIFSPYGERAGRGVFFLDYNPGRVCRILAVPVTPLLTPAQIPTSAALPTGVVIGSLICAGLLISRRLK